MAAGKKKESKMDQAMKVYMKTGTPGAPHRLLAGMEGSWAARTLSWMEPGTPPMEWMGTSKQKMILGGRYLEQEFKGEMMGSPFSGIGFTGYDNQTRKFVSIWMDSMSTGIMFFEGTARGRTITQTAQFDDPVQGPMRWRSVTKMVDDNTVQFEMYGTARRGKEVKMMAITYTRK